MAAAGWLIRRYARQRWSALLPLALIVALGAAGTFIAAGAADRTAGAYGRYLDRAEVSDMVVNPALFTTEIDQTIRNLPGVRSVTSDAFLQAWIGDGTPMTRAELEAEDLEQFPSNVIEVRGSTDGRYTTMDRPALRDGRYPTGPSEAVASLELADARDLEIGDIFTVTFWDAVDSSDLSVEVQELVGLADHQSSPDDLITPLGVEHLRVVGIATLADEVLPDGLYPRQRMIVSPDVAARYDCLPDTPPTDADHEEVVRQLIPRGCATLYRHYSISLLAGESQVGIALDDMLRQSTELNAELPEAAVDVGATYFLTLVTSTPDERQRVERSTQPSVSALALLAALAGAVTTIGLGLAVARELRRTGDDQREWWRLGLGRRERAAVLAVPLVAAVIVGVAVALVVVWLLSPVAPVGSVRSVEPSPGRQLSSWVILSALALLAAILVVISALTFHVARRSGRPAVPQTRYSALQKLLPGSARPAVDEGIRAAFGSSRGMGLVVPSCALASGVLLTAAVFAASLSAVLSTPASYGWPWDLAMMGGYGYGGMDLGAIESTLAERDDVESWTSVGFTTEVSLDGEAVPTVVGLDQRAGIDFAVVEGDLPRGANEVALGSRTAAARGLGVGDEAELTGSFIDPVRVTVSGIAVVPPLGPYQANRLAPGNGMLLAGTAYPDLAADAATFVGINLVAHADQATVLADLQDDFLEWNMWFGPEFFEYPEPVRPPEIVNAESMRVIPLLVGGLVAGASVVGLGVAVVLSVRSRRHELAILRALGFTGRQVRNSVRVQVVSTIVAALAIGVPLGIAVGRVVWRAFASQLGVVTDPSTPGWWIAAIVAGSLIVAIAAAAVPARVAARIEPAAVLRTE